MVCNQPNKYVPERQEQYWTAFWVEDSCNWRLFNASLWILKRAV